MCGVGFELKFQSWGGITNKTVGFVMNELPPPSPRVPFLLFSICSVFSAARGGGGGHAKKTKGRCVIVHVHPCINMISYRPFC